MEASRFHSTLWFQTFRFEQLTSGLAPIPKISKISASVTVLGAVISPSEMIPRSKQESATELTLFDRPEPSRMNLDGGMLVSLFIGGMFDCLIFRCWRRDLITTTVPYNVVDSQRLWSPRFEYFLRKSVCKSMDNRQRLRSWLTVDSLREPFSKVALSKIPYVKRSLSHSLPTTISIKAAAAVSCMETIRSDSFTNQDAFCAYPTPIQRAKSILRHCLGFGFISFRDDAADGWCSTPNRIYTALR